jgi:hypothetical protein
MTRRFSGIIPPLVTPLVDRDRLDRDRLDRDRLDRDRPARKVTSTIA